MVNALKIKIVPELRSQGFTDSYPHFRRFTDEKIDLLTIQFNKWGGSFLVEVSLHIVIAPNTRTFIWLGRNP